MCAEYDKRWTHPAYQLIPFITSLSHLRCKSSWEKLNFFSSQKLGTPSNLPSSFPHQHENFNCSRAMKHENLMMRSRVKIAQMCRNVPLLISKFQQVLLLLPKVSVDVIFYSRGKSWSTYRVLSSWGHWANLRHSNKWNASIFPLNSSLRLLMFHHQENNVQKPAMKTDLISSSILATKCTVLVCLADMKYMRSAEKFPSFSSAIEKHSNFLLF